MCERGRDGVAGDCGVQRGRLLALEVEYAFECCVHRREEEEEVD